MRESSCSPDDLKPEIRRGVIVAQTRADGNREYFLFSADSPAENSPEIK
jgi:hypothetical protein